MASTEEESITSEDTVWIGSSSEDEGDPNEGGAPGTSSSGDARGATENRRKADKQEKKIPEPKTTTKPDDGGCKERKEAKGIFAIDDTYQRVNYHLRPESNKILYFHKDSQCYVCEDCGLRTTNIKEAHDHTHADGVGAAATAVGTTGRDRAGEGETEGGQGEDASSIRPDTNGHRPEDALALALAEAGEKTGAEMDPLVRALHGDGELMLISRRAAS